MLCMFSPISWNSALCVFTDLGTIILYTSLPVSGNIFSSSLLRHGFSQKEVICMCWFVSSYAWGSTRHLGYWGLSPVPPHGALHFAACADAGQEGTRARTRWWARTVNWWGGCSGCVECRRQLAPRPQHGPWGAVMNTSRTLTTQWQFLRASAFAAPSSLPRASRLLKTKAAATFRAQTVLV